MNVKLLAYTPEPEKVVAMAANLCYSNKVDIESVANSLTPERIQKLLEQVISSGHHSTLEHVSFTFGIEGIDRSVSHELVRHRIASYSQRSQRYCSEGEFDYSVPETVQGKETEDGYQLEDLYYDLMGQDQELYRQMIQLGVPKEDARLVLPNATHTRIIVTMNARSLLHFFNLRMCTRAQHSIRDMASAMLKLVKPIAPTLFKKAGPSCTSLGYCPEGKMCCGKMPTLDEVMNGYIRDKMTSRLVKQMENAVE